LNVVAVRDVYQGEELLVNYRTSDKVNFGITIEGEMPCRILPWELRLPPELL
jgi:hypothetical protein